jgi:hypothetical protein
VALPDRRIRVRYRIGLDRDPAFRAELARAEGALSTGAWDDANGRYRCLAARAIEAWDLVGADALPVPISEAALGPLPVGALLRIVREAIEASMKG